MIILKKMQDWCQFCLEMLSGCLGWLASMCRGRVEKCDENETQKHDVHYYFINISLLYMEQSGYSLFFEVKNIRFHKQHILMMTPVCRLSFCHSLRISTIHQFIQLYADLHEMSFWLRHANMSTIDSIISTHDSHHLPVSLYNINMIQLIYVLSNIHLFYGTLFPSHERGFSFFSKQPLPPPTFDVQLLILCCCFFVLIVYFIHKRHFFGHFKRLVHYHTVYYHKWFPVFKVQRIVIVSA